MIPQNNKPQQAQSFGSVQETYRYNLTRFNSGEQFTIVEDMPRNKPIRFETGTAKKDGREFETKTYLIRVVSRGYEADMLVYQKELPKLAVLCPKGLENFKGCTFIFDGVNWSYMGIESPQQPISSLSQAMTPQRDSRQPDLNPAPDQRDLFVTKLTAGMQTLEGLGNKVDASVVMKICDNITPGKGIDLFQYAKGKGAISETNGVWKVN